MIRREQQLLSRVFEIFKKTSLQLMDIVILALLATFVSALLSGLWWLFTQFLFRIPNVGSTLLKVSNRQFFFAIFLLVVNVFIAIATAQLFSGCLGQNCGNRQCLRLAVNSASRLTAMFCLFEVAIAYVGGIKTSNMMYGIGIMLVTSVVCILLVISVVTSQSSEDHTVRRVLFLELGWAILPFLLAILLVLGVSLLKNVLQLQILYVVGGIVIYVAYNIACISPLLAILWAGLSLDVGYREVIGISMSRIGYLEPVGKVYMLVNGILIVIMGAKLILRKRMLSTETMDNSSRYL